MFGDEIPPDFERLSSELRQAWVAFAATGDPGWPAYSVADRQTQIWHVPPTVSADPIKASREIWEHRFSV